LSILLGSFQYDCVIIWKNKIPIAIIKC